MNVRIVERTAQDGGKSYVIQQRHGSVGGGLMHGSTHGPDPRVRTRFRRWRKPSATCAGLTARHVPTE